MKDGMNPSRRDVCAAGLGLLGGFVVSPWLMREKEEEEAALPTKIGILADSHVRNRADRIKCDQLRAELRRQCGLLINPGDVVHGESPEEWREVEIEGDEKAVAGNHDYWQEREPWKRLGMPAPYYSFEYAGLRFLMMDTGRGDGTGRGEFLVDPEQMEWLRLEIVKGPFIAVTHLPLLTAFDRGFNERANVSRLALGNGREVARIFRDSGKCQMVLSGHTHLRETVHTLGIRQEIAGAVSGFWWDKPVAPGTWPEAVRGDMEASPRALILELPSLELRPVL